MAEKKLAVETHSLSKHFGKFAAVEDVNFYIPEGEIFGLLGPNGAGKTTTIRMLCGLFPPTSGSATVLGYDIAHHTEAIKKQIGYMSQRFSLYNDLTARENLEFYAASYGVPRKYRSERIRSLLGTAGLEGHENDLTRSLSGGWRQRLALACAISHEPAMLFLDEPTAGVDPVSRREFWDMIYEMAGRGVSILATTHYMDEAEYCNTIGMMYQGRLIALASPDTLKDNLPGVLLAIDTDQPVRAEDLLWKLPGVDDVSLHGIQLHVSFTEPASQTGIEAALAAEGIRYTKIETIQPSLEDVFIHMVEQKLRQQAHPELEPIKE